jgi:parallel beta-helix repeat protein
MYSKILSLIFLFNLIPILLYPQQKWLPFSSQEKSSPSVNLITSNNNTVSFTVQVKGMFTVDQMVDEKSYQRLSIPDGEVMSKEGLPQMPMITKLIAIPDCDNVSISIIPSNELDYTNYNIIPSPKSVKKNLPDGEFSTEEIFEEDKTIYSSSSDFPDKYGEIIETGYCRDQKVARITIYPVQFNPSGKTIKVFTDFNISLSFTNPTSAVNKELGIFRNMMHHAALNYEPNGLSASSTGNEIDNIIQKNSLSKTAPATVLAGSVTRVTNLSTLVGASAIPVDYLIITHSDLYNSSYLTTLANWRRDHNGYDVVICQVDAAGTNNDIYDYENPPGTIKYPSTSTTRYVSVRNFIADVRINGKANHTGDGHLAYICLVGDALKDNNVTEMVPAAYPSSSTPPYYVIDEQGGDYYYACTGGDNDNVLDLMYGRISVGNETELSSVVNKINQYETNYWGNWNDHSMFVAFSPDLFNDWDPAIKEMTEIIPPSSWRSFGFRSFANTTVTEYNYVDEILFTQAQFTAPGLCGADELEDWIYERGYGITGGIHTFIYEGHAGWNALGANEGCPRLIFKLSDCNPPYTNTIYNRLQNSFYPFMIFNGCETGYLDYSSGDCIAEVVVNINNKGAIGCLAASRGSNSGSFGIIDKKVIQAMYNSLSHTMGEAVMESKLNMDNTWKRRYNLYGDPAVNLWPTGYTLSENLTLSGTNTISENITVPSGITLTVSAGANIRFENGASLIINNGGTLIANGTTSNKIRFDFVTPDLTKLNRIKFNSGSSGSVTNCKIVHAYCGIYATGCTPTINNNTIDSCFHGIYLDNSSPSLYYNRITKTTGAVGYGIACYNGSHPNLYYNRISGYTYGLFGYNSDNITSIGTGTGGYGINNITGNSYGIYAYNSSVVLNQAGNTGSHNNIYNNTYYDVLAEQYSDVYCTYNYWGYSYTPPPSSRFYQNNSLIEYDPALTSLVPGGLSKATASDINSDDNSGFDADLLTALNYEAENKINEAITVYQNIVKNKTNILTIKFALSRLSDCYEKNGRKDFLSYIKNEVRENFISNKIIYYWTVMLENFLLIVEQKFADYIANINTVRNIFPKDEYIDKQTLFDLGYAYLNYLENKTKALNYLAQLEKKYPDDPLVHQSKLVLGTIEGISSNPKYSEDSGNKSSKELKDIQIPVIYDLIGNYPNPFNPSTTITYALPADSKVEVIIYDIMGREVKTLVNGNNGIGYKEVVWDGRNNEGRQVSSGIYICRLKATSITDLSVFEKSIKLMLVK